MVYKDWMYLTKPERDLETQRFWCVVFANQAEDKPIHSQCDEYMDRWTVDLFFRVILAEGPAVVIMSEVTKQRFRTLHEWT